MTWDPKDEEAPLAQKIFHMNVEQEMEPMDISKALSISHQTVYEMVNSDMYKMMETDYWKVVQENMSEMQRRAVLRAKQTFIDAAPRAASNLVMASDDTAQGVRASAVKASERILAGAGVLASEGIDTESDKIALRIVISREAMQQAADLGIDELETKEILRSGSTVQNKGKLLGEALASDNDEPNA